MRGTFLAIGLISIAGGATAQTVAETQTLPASQMFPFLGSYQALPAGERDHFRMEFQIVGDAPATNVHLTLKRATGDVPMAMAPDGRILTEPSSDDLKSAKVVMTTPKGSHYGLALHLVEAEAPALTLDVAPLKAGIDQARAAAKKAAGLMAMMVPDFETVCFVGAGSGQIVLDGGKTAPLKIGAPPAAPKFLNPCLTPADMPQARQVTLAHMPSSLMIMRRPKG